MCWLSSKVSIHRTSKPAWTLAQGAVFFDSFSHGPCIVSLGGELSSALGVRLAGAQLAASATVVRNRRFHEVLECNSEVEPGRALNLKLLSPLRITQQWLELVSKPISGHL
jgi:hypothetical protein